MRARRARVRRDWSLASRRRARTWAERAPCFQRARRLRASPAGVRGPVLRPPCIRQRPFGMAGWRQEPPQRVWAPHRGAARKSPERLPFFRLPRRSAGKPDLGGTDSGRSTPCQARGGVSEVHAVMAENFHCKFMKCSIKESAFCQALRGPFPSVSMPTSRQAQRYHSRRGGTSWRGARCPWTAASTPPATAGTTSKPAICVPIDK